MHSFLGLRPLSLKLDKRVLFDDVLMMSILKVWTGTECHRDGRRGTKDSHGSFVQPQSDTLQTFQAVAALLLAVEVTELTNKKKNFYFRVVSVFEDKGESCRQMASSLKGGGPEEKS